MTSPALARVVALFVDPEAPDPEAAVPAVRVPVELPAAQDVVAPPAPQSAASPAWSAGPRLGLLAPPALVEPAALAAAQMLLRAGPFPAAFAGIWGTAVRPGPRLPATRAAARLADRLDGAEARGRLVTLGWAGDDLSVAAAAGETLGAVGELPAVIALGAARGPALDELLRQLDGVLVVTAPDALLLAAATVAGLERAAIRCRSAAFAAGPVARAFLRIGASPDTTARRTFGAALADLGWAG